MDVHDKQTRSYNMSRIKSKDTKSEMIVRKFLFANGFRYSLHDKKLPGKPDIVLPKYKTVIFVNGCFWHGHENCQYSKLPETQKEWWKSKIEHNIQRDNLINKRLNECGWKIQIIWTCEIKSNKINRLEELITNLSV